MGFFRKKRGGQAPAPQMTAFAPAVAAPSNPPINMMQIFDAVSGKNFSFVNGTNGQRYWQLKGDLADAERTGQGARASSIKEQMQQEAGKSMMTVTRDPNRLALDAPASSVNTNLPAVNFNMREAALVANLTARLRSLSNTIEVVGRTNPMLLEENRDFINNYQAANKQAMDKGFDIKQNGLDTTLTRMGLMNSSYAIGAQVALARERVDAEVQSNLQTHQLAEGLKQNTMENMFKLGNQIVQGGGLELERYKAETGNELQAAALEQDRAANQVKLNLEKSQQITNAQLADMNHSLQYAQMAQGFLNPAADRSIMAARQDNKSYLGMQQNELSKSSLGLNSWAATRAGQSDPWKSMGMGLIGTAAGAAGGPLGSMAANFVTNKFSNNRAR